MPKVSPEYLAERRAAILAAAARRFAANGFHATSMPDICAEAGMSAGGVYRYFASKDELIVELAETVMAPVLHALRAAAAADPLPQPAEIIDLIHDTMLVDSPTLPSATLMLQVWSEVVRNPRIRESNRNYMKELFDLLSNFVRRWTPANDASAQTAARALVAMSMGTFLLQNVMEAGTEATPTTSLLASLNTIVQPGQLAADR